MMKNKKPLHGQKLIARRLNIAEGTLLFLSINNCITPSEKQRIRRRMDWLAVEYGLRPASPWKPPA
jgi:hypothetical protein